jgi:NADH-quinone oxidoreductase subunit J
VNVAFYIAAGVAVLSTGMVITRRNAVHALLYLVVSFLASGVIFYVLGAPFAAVLEVIIYAGAIIVLFLFAVMLFDMARQGKIGERYRLHLRAWIGPSILAAVLLAELVYLIAVGGVAGAGAGAGAVVPAGGGAAGAVGSKQVGVSLLGPYVLGVELASLLLLAGLVGAHRLTQDAD